MQKPLKKFQNSNELLKLLKNHWWKVVAINGSHYQLKHHTITGRVTLSHLKNLPIGTLNRVLKQSKINIKNEWNYQKIYCYNHQRK